MIKDGIYSFKELKDYFTIEMILQQIKTLYKDIIEHNNDCLAISEIEFINLNNKIQFFQVRNNKIIGYIKTDISIYQKRKHYLTNTTLLINPNYQLVGYGVRLSKTLLNYINQSKIYKILEIESKEDNIKLYQRLGFKILSEIKYGMKKYNSNEYIKLYKMIYEVKN